MNGQITLDAQAAALALPILNLIGATLLVWFCWREMRRLNRVAYELEEYAFHNRTGGNTVVFKSFDAALRHRASRQSVGANLLLLYFVGPAALIWFFNALISLAEALA